ncbi:hypothetical protein ACFLY9_01900 [Patescibacteria group bacterium]
MSLSVESEKREKSLQSISKFVGSNDKCYVGLKRGDERQTLLTTFWRSMCDAVCVWGRRNGVDSVLLTHFYKSDIREHLGALKTAPKREITVVIVGYTMHYEFGLFQREFKVRKRMQEDSGCSITGNDASKLYESYKRIFRTVDTPLGRVFDFTSDLRAGVQQLFKENPIMWHVPVTEELYDGMVQGGAELQLVALRKKVNGSLRRVVFVHGFHNTYDGSFKLFVE